MVVVAYTGMLSSANLRNLDTARAAANRRIASQGSPKDLESHFRWRGTSFVDGQINDTLTLRDQRGAAAKLSNPMVKAKPVWDPTEHTKAWRAVWTYSTKRAARTTRR